MKPRRNLFELKFFNDSKNVFFWFGYKIAYFYKYTNYNIYIFMKICYTIKNCSNFCLLFSLPIDINEW